jgi:hypothetical protein
LFVFVLAPVVPPGQTLAKPVQKFSLFGGVCVRVKLSTLSLSVVCCLGMNLSLWGQNAASVPGIQGFLDPKTGIFHSVPSPQAADAEPLVTSTLTGKFVFNFTITVKSTIASTGQIGCLAGASLSDTTNLNNVAEIAAVAVTRGSGTTVTCSVTVPYSWKLGSPTTDVVHLSYSIGSPLELGTVSAYPNREGARSLGTIKVPLNGATTTETITATM